MLPEMKNEIKPFEAYSPKYNVMANEVMSELSNYMLVDGFDLILDTENSKNHMLVDKKNDRSYHDFFTYFASMPVSMNHPKMFNDSFINYIGKIAVNKPSNSDIYTEQMATFVKTFFKIAVPDYFKYSFFIDGGALAVENALKAAFDWKVRKNFSKGINQETGSQIIHFRQAFHGRSGYTMSLTNTDPTKIMYYPKFNWPRVTNPKIIYPINENNLEVTINLEKLAIDEIKEAFLRNKNDIAGIIIEPIQCEGGDNHFRVEFMKSLRELADENEALLIFDEVQTGVGLTGTMWAHEQLEVKPDIMCFGKKSQVCGILVTDRIDDIDDHVFRKSSRINSTWGGNLTDMVRATKYFEIIEEDNLVQNAEIMGEYLRSKIGVLVDEFRNIVSAPRGRGLLRAFDFHSAEKRNEFREKCYDAGLMILPCGEKSIRFRTALDINEKAIDDGFEIILQVIRGM